MAPKKKLSIGITINLENYENLRLEVDGEVTGAGDAEELIAYLDGVLAQLGRTDEKTAERIDSYRRRVLAQPETIPAAVEAEVEEAATVGMPEKEEIPVVAEPAEIIRDGNLSESLYHTPMDSECVGEDADHSAERGVCVGIPCESGVPEEICEAAPPAPQPPKKEEKAKPEKGEEFTCSACGAAITKAQEQLSQLFMGRALCKKCMEEQG